MANVAIIQDGYDKEDPLRTLKLVTKPIPKPAPGQVVVHIKLRPINPTDFITLRSGGIAKGGTPGSEGYGVIYEVSSNLRL
jgi:trans-2-enoyl-CoA reductase